MSMNKKLSIVVLALGTALNLQAEIKLPAVLSDNMVLQQQSDARFWGWAAPGEKVEIKGSWEEDFSAAVTAGEDGKWKTSLKTPKAGGPYTVTVKGANTIKLENVLIGEVWVCSGQSNMEFRLPHVVDGKQEVAEADYPQIRFFNVSGAAPASPADDVKGQWVECRPESAGEISAVAYFFGRKIHRDLKVPMGLITPAMGATPARAWTSGKTLVEKNMYAHEVKIVSDKDYIEKAKAKYEAEMVVWQEAAEKAKAEGAPEPSRPRGLPRIGARWPSAMFNGMISPLTSSTIKGAIWYQGENDVSGVGWYAPLFPNLIQSWRDAWGLGDFPFYHVQLPPYDYGSSNSALLREVQMKSLSMKNVGMAVTLDVGDYQDVHPKNKKDVGERLALWALANDYGQKDLVCCGPIYQGMKVEGGRIRLSFDHTGSGLVAKDGALANFVIAGADKKFVPAKATIENKTVVVSSDTVAEPVAVRYAFDNAGVPSLFNKEGLPASSFRTDEW
jgi:sialate O-acetylesterase